MGYSSGVSIFDTIIQAAYYDLDPAKRVGILSKIADELWSQDCDVLDESRYIDNPYYPDVRRALMNIGYFRD